MNSTSFGKNDPVFGYDIGYFMFQKPFIEFMIMYLLFIVIGIAIYSAIYYIATFNIYFEGISRETIKTIIKFDNDCGNITCRTCIYTYTKYWV